MWIGATVAKVSALLARLDPNDDPEAEPLTVAAAAAIVVTAAFSAFMFLRWKYPPMLDLGHHMAIAAVVADRGRPGSLYTDLYQSFDPLYGNSLLYLLGGTIGRLIGVTTAVKLLVSFYFIGVPLAVVYGLRLFGRSAWPAVLATPMLYAQLYIAGVANMLFAAPLFVLAVPLFYQTLQRPTRRLIVVTATVFLSVFLAHAHLFLALGPLAVIVLVALVAVRWTSMAVPVRERLRAAARTVGVALLCVVPALLVFARWYVRTFGAARGEGGIGASGVTQPLAEGFGARFRSATEMLAGIPSYPLKSLLGDFDLWWWVAVGLTTVVAVSIGRMHRYRRAPVLELTFAVVLSGYFFLPEHLSGHAGVASRHLSMSFWFLPVFLSPVPARVSRVGRNLVIAAIVGLTVVHQAVWYRNLAQFQRTEARDLEVVMDAAPPRKRLHYVKINGGSRIFYGGPFMHIEKFYMSDKFGQTADTTGVLSTGAVRFQPGVNVHRIVVHRADFGKLQEIWDNFDLVLVRSWRPTPAERALTEAKATLLKRSGEWELWQTTAVGGDPRSGTPPPPSK